MAKYKWKTLVSDFETTVYEGQEFTEVWASASVEIGTEDVFICTSIDDQFKQFCDIIKQEDTNLIVYYHNLKFDGSFWLDFFYKQGYKQAYYSLDENTVKWKELKELNNKEYEFMCTKEGQWYTITLKINNHLIEFRDSLKLIPLSIENIGNSFKTKHRKTTIEYKGMRAKNGTLTDKEKEYISNDVLVLKEALEIMFSEGHNSLTIGSCCVKEFRKTFRKQDFKAWFPNINTDKLPLYLQYQINIKTPDDYIRKSYKGGWCYLVKGKENKIFTNGLTADVNSLYPSVMSSKSTVYPIGMPHFFKGKVPEKIQNGLYKDYYYFVTVRMRFNLKKNHLPCIQVKDNGLYNGTEWLETSDIIHNGKRYKYYTEDGKIKDAKLTLTFTCTDWLLVQEQYDITDLEYIGGCYFSTISNDWLFNDYIKKYRKLKENSTGGMRTIAKLFLNNLYGKLATNNDSSFKISYLEDDILRFRTQEENEKELFYIPCGSAVTSWARNFTIRTAQANYYGVDKRGFIYADTDSIHCDLDVEELVNVPIDNTKFEHWKIENQWDKAIFVRQKTYIEHTIKEDMQTVEKPYYLIKCAGMGKRCKELLNASLTGEKIETYNKDEEEFIKEKRELTDFKIGLEIPSKLIAKYIKGGILLTDTTFKLLE